MIEKATVTADRDPFDPDSRWIVWIPRAHYRWADDLAADDPITGDTTYWPTFERALAFLVEAYV